MSPRRRVLVVGAALAVVLGLVAAVAAAAGLWRRAEPELARAAEVPVLVVPGYNGSPTSVGNLAARLRAAGRRGVVVARPARGTRALRG